MKYRSELTKDLYETEEAAKKAERDLEATKAKNAELAKAKKQEATKVEDAFKARNAARREYNTKLVEARKIYNDAIIAAKKAFNETLEQNDIYRDVFGGADQELEDTEYWNILNLAGDGIMGYLHIPSISVKLPIYHGVEEDILQTTSGHLNGTRL